MFCPARSERAALAIGSAPIVMPPIALAPQVFASRATSSATARKPGWRRIARLAST